MVDFDAGKRGAGTPDARVELQLLTRLKLSSKDLELVSFVTLISRVL